jgi:glycylpeptide N-tetradecanoyltransferase
MYDGFEWVTMDLDDPKELQEVYELLSAHYVEDKEAMFRFHYTASFFNWSLKAPGWKKDWHVGVRATGSKKLVAFISGIPVDLRVRKNIFKSSEVNFLCIHKKLRAKRLTPVLIKEITRRCYLVGTYQAIYTAGVMLPTPVTTCRYFHRAIDWMKLYELKFSPLPPGSTPQRQVAKFKLPEKTATPGLRAMEPKDVPGVTDLLNRYLGRFDMQQHFSEEEVKHWLLHDEKLCPERVVYAYVVEDPSSHKVTDFFSFYNLASTAIASKKYQFVNAAYMYYYASEAAFDSDKSKLEIRLNLLIKDALILAKKVCNLEGICLNGC